MAASQEYEQLKEKWRRLLEKTGLILDDVGYLNLLTGIQTDCTEAIEKRREEIDDYLKEDK